MFSTLFLLALPLAGLASANAINLPRDAEYAKRADICGVRGYDRGRGNFRFSSSGKAAGYAKCSAACAADSRCLSFGYGHNDCALFNRALAGNFNSDRRSSHVYYDVGCMSVKTTTTASAPAAAKTTTIASASAAAKTTTASVAAATTTAVLTTTTTAPVEPVSTDVPVVSNNGTTGLYGNTTTTSNSSSSAVDSTSVNNTDTVLRLRY